MRTAHGVWATVAVVTAGGIGLWTLLLVPLQVKPGKGFRILGYSAAGALLGQVVLGLLTYQQGYRPESNTHVLIGFIIFGVLLAAAWLQVHLTKHPAVWGLTLLMLAGLGVVAMRYVSA